MPPTERKELLAKYFASEDYIRAFHKHYEIFWQNLIEALNEFESNLPPNYEIWPKKNRTEIWYSRVMSRYITKDIFEQEIKSHLAGNSINLEGTTDIYRSLMTNIRDSVTDKWLDYIAPQYKEEWENSYRYGVKMANNICYTLSGDWEDNEILNDSITGPIDEADLQRFKQGLNLRQ